MSSKKKRVADGSESESDQEEEFEPEEEKEDGGSAEEQLSDSAEEEKPKKRPAKKKAKASAKSSENRPSKKVKKAEETEFVFELSKMRKCTVGTFKGMVLVNIREYYTDKNSGEEKPGYKGLALQANQWASLMTRVSDIDAAAQSSEEVKFDLGGKKKCSVREFKGKTLVDLREYYEDKNTGEEKPGKKGISLSTEQWLALKDAADDIDEAVKMFS